MGLRGICVGILFLKRYTYIGNPPCRKGGEGGFENPGGGSMFTYKKATNRYRKIQGVGLSPPTPLFQRGEIEQK
jgi:hypothetical protein